MALPISPIYDRTQLDVIYAKANRNSAEDLKGARNASDLNRIATNLNYISDEFNALGYGTDINLKTDWVKTDIPRLADIQAIIDATNTVRTVLTIDSSIPATPEIPINTILKMNNLEQIIYQLDIIIQGIIYQINLKRAGTFNAGSEGGMI